MPASVPPRTADLHPSLGASLSGTNLERAGDHNQRVMLQAIRVSGPITRAELATITGLTAPAIANITKRLLNDGLIMEVGRLHGARGQPAMRLAINPDGCYSIGVNIDRDHVTVLVLDLLGQVRHRATLDVDFPLPDTVAAFFKKQVDALQAGGTFPQDRIVGIGVAMPDDLGRVNLPNRPASYEAWNTVNVARLFSAILPLPVFLENDAAAAALGELQFGHGLHDPSFFYILISRGLGGGMVIDGQYFRGAQGRSGEIGFLPVSSPRTPATSLQEAVSLSALFGFLKANGYPLCQPDELAGLDATGQALVAQWLDLAAELLTVPIIAVSCLVNPEAVFLGGRLPTTQLDRLAQLITERLQAHAGTIPVIAPVHRAATAMDAPAVGAAILPFNDRLLPSRTALMKTAAA
ncbi:MULTISPECIES: ROK family transcriptional regulator [Nitrospirillum]|uniref:MarR family transcriptional regulator n=1 Tax=Nitrospirillum amazonense TaxID=28077 RepID=A0A560G998_9PROT|nr:ROK family transcriptional regulator [Nitrospirillum amazonense]MEC4591804.1 ROK family transcriptional regulator [Nitrospirillum amazonense]TWB30447.1 MarR family transcriptional regulator [Nitrospirillum amazonense]